MLDQDCAYSGGEDDTFLETIVDAEVDTDTDWSLIKGRKQGDVAARRIFFWFSFSESR